MRKIKSTRDPRTPEEMAGQVTKNKDDIATQGAAIATQGETIAAQGDKIQNCVQSLDDSIVAAVCNQGMFGVAGKNVINEGYNAITGDGVAFVKTPEGFYIGGGHENNFIFNDAVNSYSTINKIDNWEYTYECTTNTWMYIPCQNGVSAGQNYLLSFFSVKDLGNISAHSTATLNFYKKEKVRSGFKYILNIKQTTDYQHIFVKPENLNNGDIFKVEKSLIINNVSETSNNVPFVPVSFRGGELIIDESLTTEKHSFIIKKNKKYRSGYNTLFPYFCNSQGSGIGGEYPQFNNVIEDEETVFLISKSCQKALVKGKEYTGTINNQGESQGSISLQRIDDGGQNELVYFVAIEGDLSEEELKKNATILESRNYQLPPSMQGTILPISDMVRRSNKYGIVNDLIEVTDVSRDLWYIEPGMYEVIDNDLVTHYVRVNADGSITGTALEDVSGRLRVAASIALPAQVRKVK